MPQQVQTFNFAWDRLNKLRAISIIQMVVIAPFFAIWTVYGTIILIKITNGSASCETPGSKQESYAFLIFWFILSYVLLQSYVCLLCYGYSQVKKSANIKKVTLQVLRRVNHDPEMANEIYENSRANIQEEIIQHQ